MTTPKTISFPPEQDGITALDGTHEHTPREALTLGNEAQTYRRIGIDLSQARVGGGGTEGKGVAVRRDVDVSGKGGDGVKEPLLGRGGSRRGLLPEDGGDAFDRGIRLVKRVSSVTLPLDEEGLLPSQTRLEADLKSPVRQLMGLQSKTSAPERKVAAPSSSPKTRG